MAELCVMRPIAFVFGVVGVVAGMGLQGLLKINCILVQLTFVLGKVVLNLCSFECYVGIGCNLEDMSSG